MPAFTLPNLITWVAQGVAVVIAAALLARALRLSDPRGRMALCRLLLVLCLALLVAAPAPETPAPRAAQPHVPQSAEVAAAARAAAPGSGETGDATVTLSRTPAPLLAGVLAGGALLRLGWLAVGVMWLRALRRTASRSRSTEAFDWAGALVGATADLLVSSGVTQPATFGLRRPVVVVPPAFESWPRDVQRALATHELLHVRRSDWAYSIAEELARVALWFHPAAWWLVDRIRLAREQIVDREVVRLTGDRRGYLEALVGLASAGASPAPAAAAAFLRRPHLLDRVAHLTKEVPMARLRLAMSLSAAGMGALAFTMVAARAVPLDVPLTPVMAEPSRAQPIDTAAVRRSEPPAPVHKVPVQYPSAAAGLEGPVVLQVTTDEEGVPTDVQPLLGAAELTGAAVEAMRLWRFEARREPSTFVLAVNVRPDTPEPVVGIETKRIGSDIRPPAKVFDVRPAYPADAREAGVQGVVIIEATIDVDGRVSVGRVLRPVDPRLDAAALDAVLRWQFSPTLVDGVFHPVFMTVTVNFVLA